jgi:hypothetical protein
MCCPTRLHLKSSMMTRFTLLACLIVLALLPTGCKKDAAIDTKTSFVELDMLPSWQGYSLILNQLYDVPGGMRLKPDQVKFYVSNLRLVKADSSEIKLADVILFDLGSTTVATAKTNHNGSPYYYRKTVPAGNYLGIRFDIGVPASMNTSNPASFVYPHPLAIEQATHWSWASGYRFVIFDGKLDTTLTGNGAFDFQYTYHTGTDTLLTRHSFVGGTHAFTLGDNQETRFTVEMDFAKLFFPDRGYNIDMVAEPQCHTLGNDFPLAQKLTENLKSIFFAYHETTNL